MVRPLIALEPGRLVAGRYRLLRPIGSGGSADVWAARDESLGREVAVKALTGSTAQGGHERERLRREARLLATLDHPRITTVFDYAEALEPDGTTQPVLVTELVDGVNLGARLRRGPLPSEQALAVCAQVAEALATAHRAGVVHRDVKPGNVMLTADGAKLLDFGISRRDSDTDLTGSVLLGTPACMAPEQWRGRSAQPASDVYALGCLLFWCLSGHAPYAERALPALGLAHLQDDAPPLPLAGPPRAVDEVYHACMGKDPAARPDAGQVAEVLSGRFRPHAMSTATRAAAESTTMVIEPARWPRGRLLAGVAVAGAVLAAAIVLPLTLSGAGPDGQTGGGTASRPTTSVSAPTATASKDANAPGVAASRNPAGSTPGETGSAPTKTHGKGDGKGGKPGGGPGTGPGEDQQ